MERVRRRFWTGAVSVLAVVVITGAIISGLFQLAVLALPSYREDLSAWVTEVAGRPVQIGGVSLVWRGVYPRLDLSDITLFSPNGEKGLSAKRLSLGFSLTGLVQGEVFPDRIELSGLKLAVNVDEEGHIEIAGFDTLREAAPRSRDAWLRDLSRFEGVRLENCEVLLRHARFGDTPLPFTISRADLDRGPRGFEADGQLRLPARYGTSASFTAQISGDIARQGGWSGQFELNAAELVAQSWLAPWLAPGAGIQADQLSLHLAGEVREGGVSALELRLDSGALLATQGGRSATAQSGRLALKLQHGAEGWRAQVNELAFDREPQLHAALRYQTLQTGYELDVDADFARLTRLAPWLGLWRDAPPALALAARSGGELHSVVLRLRQGETQPQYSLRASVNDLSLRADRRIGFAGVSGELSASEAGGRFQLDGRPVQLRLPSVLSEAIPFEALTGTAEWQRQAEGWQIAMRGFGWRLASSQGSGQFRLLLPDDAERSPELNLVADFSAEDPIRLKPYMPLRWGENLRQWLTRAIQAGRVPRAHLAIKGPLADFPFDRRKTGEWNLDIDALGVKLAFAPDWPVLDDIGAHLRFRGNSLKVESRSASFYGNKAERVVARFDDFRDRLLTLDVEAGGETARFYQFLRASPLKRTLAGLVDHTTAAGPAQLRLHLDIPIEDVQKTRASGVVALNNVEMFYRGLDQPISAINGEIAFSNDGVSAEQLSAHFADVALDARIEPREGTHGVVRARFDYTPDGREEGVGAYIPGLLRDRIEGTSRWLAELPIGTPDSALALTSDLVGTAVRLPPPLGKPAEEAAPVLIAIGADPQADVRVRVGYAARLGADIAMRRSEGGQIAVRAMELRLGRSVAPRASGEGLRLGGEVAELDLPAWTAVLQSSEIGGVGVRDAEVTAGRLLFGHQAVGPTHVRYTPTAEGWRMTLKGAGAEGDVDFIKAGGGVVRARLAHLSMDVENVAQQQGGAETSTTEEPIEPAAWPALDLLCERLLVGGVGLGRLQLNASHIPGGLQLDALSLTGGKLDASASGRWRRVQGQSDAQLSFDLASTDISEVLHAFEYAPNLSARSSHFTGELSWSGDTEGIRWEEASGPINLRIENGSLKAVEPGAGRVLGLINFYALPRRLTLDFRDVVNKGLAFDAITGNFALADGQANTDDLKIDAPSLRMEMRGRVGLVARDYDQRVTVYPDVSAGITLGAALLGGPALGALVLLAQEVLDKPLDQATQLSYRLTGTWDNPKVERLVPDGRNAPPG